MHQTLLTVRLDRPFDMALVKAKLEEAGCTLVKTQHLQTTGALSGERA